MGGPVTIATTSTTPTGGKFEVLLLVAAVSGIAFVLLSVLLVGCCLHKRRQNRMKRGWLRVGWFRGARLESARARRGLPLKC